MRGPSTLHNEARLKQALTPESRVKKFTPKTRGRMGFWRTISVSACEGSISHKGNQSASRKIGMVYGHSLAGWGCSECAWLFNFSGPLSSKSLEEMKRNFQVQLSKEFTSMLAPSTAALKAEKLFPDSSFAANKGRILTELLAPSPLDLASPSTNR